MISAHSTEAVRAAEQPLLAAGKGPALMRAAAHGLAMGVVSLLRSHGHRIYGARVTLLVGSGNNGGDALYAGAWLASHGARATALLADTRTHPAALAAFEQAGGRCLALADDSAASIFITEAMVSHVVIDGLLGTGSRGGLRGAAAAVVAELDGMSGAQRPLVVACDLPSGVEATTGEVHGPVLRADLTVTFGAYKSGLLSAPAEQLCGKLKLIDLGISGFLGAAPVRRLEPGDCAALLPNPLAADHKYTRGVAGIIAGSAQYPGAGLLAVAAASACGPGMVRYLGPAEVAAALHLRNPEVVCSEDSPTNVRVQAWLIGPGIDGDEAQLQRAREALASARAAGIPVVVDAAGLALINPSEGGENSRLVLTPHAGELAALLTRCGRPMSRSEIEASPLAAARAAAAFLGAVVLLKGPTTVVANPQGSVLTQANGNARLATAGSGDTLAGILVALLAMDAARGSTDELIVTDALAAAVHGELSSQGSELVGESPRAPLNAGMLAARIPAVWAKLSTPLPTSAS
ncbi:yjeF C-terminal region, hydroxyethylthiazole kinase-related/yjeF N-terminal region [Arthrobacter alpinus]|uniref:Bifunctional NAD(P)H-hydrate repair enzyme n=1 Tax=Arthrobacter alpinus TaxID=656366 RepID=A0A1H5NK37_9MICC|nr:bifunctional ADP-dependent NAD(P)H-hydrate dehydratase/NAD(P)H-hydrate epimerase [Arthrobacter alpinus]SEF01830.1 yjeF C-terminal region, hydroxyethylthiazole kinase-related/yjeF N-terminal region [Arthrobacter alpinus]